MVLIYGNYHWGKKDRISDRAYCGICGRSNRPVRSYTAWEVGHAMFVPLVPCGRIRVVRHCLTCKRFYMFALKGRRLKTAVQEQRADALGRVGQNLDQALSDLASLAHLGDFEGAQAVLDQLAVRDEAAHALAEARFMGLCGDAERAERSFAKAIHLRPRSSQACFWFGQFLLIHERDEEAIAQLRCAGELGSDEGTLRRLIEDFVTPRPLRPGGSSPAKSLHFAGGRGVSSICGACAPRCPARFHASRQRLDGARAARYECRAARAVAQCGGRRRQMWRHGHWSLRRSTTSRRSWCWGRCRRCCSAWPRRASGRGLRCWRC